MTRSIVSRTAITLSIAVLALAASNGALAGKPKIKQPPKLKAALTATGVVSLRTASGAPATHLSPGWFTLTIADNSHTLSFHIFGPGVNRSTGVRFRGVALWGIHFRAGVYRYRSDPGAHMTGVLRVS